MYSHGLLVPISLIQRHQVEIQKKKKMMILSDKISSGILLALLLLISTSGTKGALAQTNDASSGDAVAPFFGFMGAASALVFANIGAAYGTAKSGVGIASMGVMRPELVMKSVIAPVMAGVLGIYGLIIAVIISTNITPTGYTLFQGYAHLSSGLACGLSGLAAGMAIGIIGDAGVSAPPKDE